MNGVGYQTTNGGADWLSPSHNRVALIGATAVAMLLIAMGGLAYLKAQDAPSPIRMAPVTMTVPHGASAELADSLADAAALSKAAAPVYASGQAATVRVPHGAAPVQ